MSLTELILLILKLSILLNVLALGLRATFADATHLLRSPRLFARAALSMEVILPLVAVAIVMAFDLRPAVKMALIALSVSPVPPLLPRKALTAGGSATYTIGLLTAMAALSIVSIPVALELLERIFDVPLAIPTSVLFRVVLTTVLAPLAVGIALRAAWPKGAERAARWVGGAGNLLLVLSVLPVLFGARAEISALVGDGTLATFAGWALAGVVVGHALGGPERENRPVLALATASRHPGVALSIAQANFPDQKVAVAAVLLFLVVNLVVSVGYIAWVKHRNRSRSIAGPLSATVAPSRPARG
jgi:bile acid:Na+ symporter, BASS family